MNEDQRSALAIFLCIMVVMVYMQVAFPRPAPQAAPAGNPAQTPLTQEPAGSALPPGITAFPAVSQSAARQLAAPQLPPSGAEIEQSAHTVVESPLFSLKFAHLGGRISSFRLRNYRKLLNEPELLDVIAPLEGQPLPLGLYLGDLSDERIAYQLAEFAGPAPAQPGVYTIAPGGELTLTFEGQLSADTKIRKTLRFRGDSYLFNLNSGIEGKAAANGGIWLEWVHVILPGDRNEKFYPSEFSVLGVDRKRESIGAAGMAEGLVPQEESSLWASFMNTYFTATLIPNAAGRNSLIGKRMVRDAYGRELAQVYITRVRGEVPAGEFSLYIGPKDLKILENMPYEMKRVINLGVFSFLAFPLLWLLNAFYDLIHNYGLAIILLTLLVKLVFLPLTKASFVSMRAMQEIQPEIKALRERIKDSTQLNQEMLALYKKKGVNPMGGCLPMLIQIPVFFGLFSALRSAIELRHAPFALWITDLSAPEYLRIFGLPLPVMTLLMGLSFYIQQRYTPTPADPAQEKVMKIMPLVFTAMLIIFQTPSGLSLYMLVNSAISIIQQVYLRSDKKASPLTATVVASAGIFAIGFVLTLL